VARAINRFGRGRENPITIRLKIVMTHNGFARERRVDDAWRFRDSCIVTYDFG
jgi:hypothetical protein